MSQPVDTSRSAQESGTLSRSVRMVQSRHGAVIGAASAVSQPVDTSQSAQESGTLLRSVRMVRS
jgi:hypothetical protein